MHKEDRATDHSFTADQPVSVCRQDKTTDNSWNVSQFVSVHRQYKATDHVVLSVYTDHSCTVVCYNTQIIVGTFEIAATGINTVKYRVRRKGKLLVLCA